MISHLKWFYNGYITTKLINIVDISLILVIKNIIKNATKRTTL